MKETKKTYVELRYPGLLFTETDLLPVRERNPQAIAKKYPNAFAFQFFDVMETSVTVGGDKKTVQSRRKNESPTYFPEGKLYTKEQILAMNKKGEYTILLSNMRSGNWFAVVFTRRGNVQPFDSTTDEII